MQPDRYSRTALAAAFYRAQHHLHDEPKLLDDPYAQRLLTAAEMSAFAQRYVRAGLDLGGAPGAPETVLARALRETTAAATVLARALAQLGITFIAAQSPQAKGRVERLWGVLQDRLRSELRLANACDIDSANRLLGKFIADYNRRFARTPRDAAKAWRPAPDDLQRICAFRHERIVSNDNVVQWDGRRFQIPPQNRRFSFAGAKIQLYQTLDGRVSLYYGDTRLEHTNAQEG